MPAGRLECLVEEPSMEAFLRALLPRVLARSQEFEVHSFQGKDDLLRKLEARLRGYAAWMPAGWRIVVLVDRDDDDCRVLKSELEAKGRRAGLLSRGRAGNASWQVVNRIAIEELEAWYFGDWQAVCAAYPGTASTVPQRRPFRNPDAILGGTWEVFERVMQGHGYFRGGLAKVAAARAIGALVDPGRTTSASFRAFVEALAEAVS